MKRNGIGKNMKVRLVLMAVAMLVAVGCSERDGGEDAPVPVVADEIAFSKETVTYGTVTLPYRKAEIALSQGVKPALAVYLHGGSSRGSDNEAQMGEAGVDSIAAYLRSSGVASVFLVPQCPSGRSWGGTMNAVLRSLIGDAVSDFGIDRSRIYVFGGSMGGTGTWGMVSAYPALFAAAMPVAGNPSGLDASKVAGTAVFTVMGTADEVMDVAVAEAFCDSLVALGGVAVCELEEGWTHEQTCARGFTSARLGRVFGYRRGI